MARSHWLLGFLLALSLVGNGVQFLERREAAVAQRQAIERSNADRRERVDLCTALLRQSRQATSQFALWTASRAVIARDATTLEACSRASFIHQNSALQYGKSVSDHLGALLMTLPDADAPCCENAEATLGDLRVDLAATARRHDESPP